MKNQKCSKLPKFTKCLGLSGIKSIPNNMITAGNPPMPSIYLNRFTTKL